MAFLYSVPSWTLIYVTLYIQPSPLSATLQGSDHVGCNFSKTAQISPPPVPLGEYQGVLSAAERYKISWKLVVYQVVNPFTFQRKLICAASIYDLLTEREGGGENAR